MRTNNKRTEAQPLLGTVFMNQMYLTSVDMVGTVLNFWRG